MTRFAGIDVGGTKSAAVLIDGDGSTVARTWVEHGARDAGRLVEIVRDSLEGLLHGSGVEPTGLDGVGVAVSGLVSDDRSTVVRAPTLGERGLELGEGLTAWLGRPVVVVNDANATLFGHARRAVTRSQLGGSATGVTLLIALGTGLGGAVMIGDRLLSGAHGFAAELGHIAVDFADERTCPCGSRGCVEQFASGRGLAELAAADPPPLRSRTLLGELGATPPYSTRDIVSGAAAADAWATGLLERSGAMLGRAVAMLCIVLDPESVIIGGSFGHATSQWLLPAAERELRERWPFALERPIVELTLDELGPFAAATGAAAMAAEAAAKDTT